MNQTVKFDGEISIGSLDWIPYMNVQFDASCDIGSRSRSGMSHSMQDYVTLAYKI